MQRSASCFFTTLPKTTCSLSHQNHYLPFSSFSSFPFSFDFRDERERTQDGDLSKPTSRFGYGSMTGERTPYDYPSSQGPSFGQGSVSAGKSSLSQENRRFGHSNISQQSFSSRPKQTSPERVAGNNNAKGPESDPLPGRFDICLPDKTIGPVKLSPSLLKVNREKRKELERAKDVQGPIYLRPGMILLKNFINHQDQVKIVQSCRKLGLGDGGFYRPGYRDGAKMHLQMMCLGKNWDPESRKYEDQRPLDGAVASKIPEEFRKLVDSAIQASHDYLRNNPKVLNVEAELPTMSPDICIVNFYSNTGRLGLHQDRDESDKSLHEGLPVVSFSIGGSADFLYGEDRNEDMAERVVLESGDVLIFGGKSRHIFHGVKAIYPDKAPQRLMDESRLRPGRLNLTFRQY